MNKTTIIFSILALLSISAVVGQQDPNYTQYMYNQSVINPAYAGSRGVMSLGLLGRTQWVGVNGSPQTFTMSLNAPISNSVGLGFSIIHDEIGPVKEDNIFADFSYSIPVSDYATISFGIKGGVTLLNVRNLDGLEYGDPLLNEPINESSPNFGAGLYYHSERFYVGFSVPNLLETRHLEKNNGQVTTSSEEQHFFLTSGFVFNLNENLKLKPSTFIGIVSSAPISVDISANLLMYEKLEFGLSYRLDDAISAIVGFNVTKDFRIGYAYDHTTSNLGEYNSGSHEILLLFDFNKKKVKSSRFF